jgi:hypothetical protein
MERIDMLSPEKVVLHLRRIAAKIDASENPDPARVKHDIRLLASALTRKDRLARMAAEMLQIAQDDIELGPWDSEEGKNVERVWDQAHKEPKPDVLVHTLKSLGREIMEMITELKRDPSKPKPGKPHDSDVVTSAPPAH